MAGKTGEGLADLYAALRGRSSWSFWLDSAASPSPWARWSFLGSDPELILVWCEGQGSVWQRQGCRTAVTGEPWDLLRHVLGERRLVAPPGGPPGARALLLLAYDLGCSAAGWRRRARREQDVPDLVCLLFDEGWTYDHNLGRLWVWKGEAGRVRWREAAPVRRPVPPPAPAGGWRQGTGGGALGRGRYDPPGVPVRAAGQWSLDGERYRRAVVAAKEYIAAGEIYQVNLTRRYRAPWGGDLLAFYRRLRAVNPEPFAGLVEGPGFAVASASPELFLEMDALGRVITRPIKGTRPRSPDPRRDAALARELGASAKDRAELLMIVDLERNDLGRVCRPGSVRVPALFTLESHPAVHHLVATVEGMLRPGCDFADLLAATFPGGSVTGAPKIRAMEVIEELEPVRRGFYTGSMGFLGLDGSLELNILIRSCFFANGWVHVHAGGGITAGSDPDAELAESEVKAASLLATLAETEHEVGWGDGAALPEEPANAVGEGVEARWGKHT